MKYTEISGLAVTLASQCNELELTQVRYEEAVSELANSVLSPCEREEFIEWLDDTSEQIEGLKFEINRTIHAIKLVQESRL